jgi:hypothetical protein
MAPANPLRTLNVLIRGRFVLVFPECEVLLEKEGDFALFGSGMPHSYRSVEESFVSCKPNLKWRRRSVG